MALSYKTRKRLSLLIILVGLPLYIVVAIKVISLFDRPSILVELGVYIALGFLWVFPLKPIFKGVGAPDPDAPEGTYASDPETPEKNPMPKARRRK